MGERIDRTFFGGCARGMSLSKNMDSKEQMTVRNPSLPYVINTWCTYHVNSPGGDYISENYINFTLAMT